MEKAEHYARAIRAGLAYTGTTRRELAAKMGLHYDTLGRKLKHPEGFTLSDLEKADRAVRWTAFMEEADR